MPDRPVQLTRADLPVEFTPDTLKTLPVGTLRRLADHRNAILTADEQRAFDRAMHELMRSAAQRVSRRLNETDWSNARRGQRARNSRSGRSSGRADKQLEQQLDRVARSIGQRVDIAGTLAPDVDWSFAQPAPDLTVEAENPPDVQPVGAGSSDDSGTVADLENRITDQVELVEIMSDIAQISRRTYALEQQRDLQSTRTLFFGLVVSIAVLVAGWAPLVSAPDWVQRCWIIGLTVGTCVLAAVVYAVTRKWQNERSDTEASTDQE